MDRRRWLQYERSQRAPDRCLFGAAPKGEKNPLSARARSSQVEKRTVKIGVGLLPYVWIGSVWQKRRPVITNLSAYRGRVSIDATSLRMVTLGMATSRDNAIPEAATYSVPPGQTSAGPSWLPWSRTAILTGIRSGLRLHGSRPMIASKLS
jgi:hypothetical protein